MILHQSPIYHLDYFEYCCSFILTHFKIITVFCLASCIHCAQQKEDCSDCQLIVYPEVNSEYDPNILHFSTRLGRKNMFLLLMLASFTRSMFCKWNPHSFRIIWYLEHALNFIIWTLKFWNEIQLRIKFIRNSLIKI